MVIYLCLEICKDLNITRLWTLNETQCHIVWTLITLCLMSLRDYLQRTKHFGNPNFYGWQVG